MKKLFINRFVFFVACLLLLTGFAGAQDLGSSNKLFGGGKKTATTRTAKKPAAKRKPAVSKVHKPVKKAPVVVKPNKQVHPSNPKINTQNKITDVKKNDNATKSQNNAGMPPGKATNDLFNKLIGEGNTARYERNYVAAETAYQRARAIKPNDSRAIYGLGTLYTDQQRWDDAENAYRRALLLESENAIADIALSYVLTQPLTAPNLSDRYEEAEKLARRSIELAPANALAFDQLGVSLELRGLIGADTENAYRQSIRLDPTFAPAHAHLGRLLRQRGLERESAAEYQNAIRLSTDVATMVLVAEVMQSEQRFAESEDLLRTALADDPRNPSALLLLGHALTTSGKYAEAERMLRKCLEVSPGAFMPNSLLGSLFTRQGKFEMAENALLQALRLVSPNQRPMLSRQFESVGDGYMKSGKPAAAGRSYRQALTLDPENKELAAKIPKPRRG